MKYVGPLSFTIFLSLVIGKTLGIGLMSFVGNKVGYPPPPGIGLRECFMIGFIASIGLTVALFVSGVAYPTSPLLEGEAKMGALFSIASAIIAIILSKTCCKFSVPEVKRKRSNKFIDVDVDSESDDEEIDDIMVNSVIGTIRDVEKTTKELEKIAGIKTKVLLKKERKEKFEQSMQRIKSNKDSPNRSSTISNIKI